MVHTKTIQGYIFNSIEDAENAVDLINSTLGIPVSPDAITRTYTSYGENNGTIYIQSDEIIESILGAPVNIELTFSDIVF